MGNDFKINFYDDIKFVSSELEDIKAVAEKIRVFHKELTASGIDPDLAYDLTYQLAKKLMDSIA